MLNVFAAGIPAKLSSGEGILCCTTSELHHSFREDATVWFETGQDQLFEHNQTAC